MIEQRSPLGNTEDLANISESTRQLAKKTAGMRSGMNSSSLLILAYSIGSFGGKGPLYSQGANVQNRPHYFLRDKRFDIYRQRLRISKSIVVKIIQENYLKNKKSVVSTLLQVTWHVERYVAYTTENDCKETEKSLRKTQIAHLFMKCKPEH